MESLLHGRNVSETASRCTVEQFFITPKADQRGLRVKVEVVMVPRSVIHLVSPAPAIEDKPPATLIEHLNSAPMRSSLAETSRKPGADPYLLLLLADQEMIEGRDEQARYLVEAAYAVFDRRANATNYTFNLTG